LNIGTVVVLEGEKRELMAEELLRWLKGLDVV
jgi:hypothetical protein